MNNQQRMNNRQRLGSVHPDLVGFAQRGGLFDVYDANMENKVGRRVMLKQTEGCGERFKYPHEIIGVQRIWNGEITYRAIVIWPDGKKDCFGAPVPVEQIEQWLN